MKNPFMHSYTCIISKLNTICIFNSNESYNLRPNESLYTHTLMHIINFFIDKF